MIVYSNNIMGVFTESIEECEKDVERFKNWPEMAEISKDVAQILRDAEKSMPLLSSIFLTRAIFSSSFAKCVTRSAARFS